MAKDSKASPAKGGKKGEKYVNSFLIRGLRKDGKSAARSASGRWRFIKKGPAGKKTEKKAVPKTEKKKAEKLFYEAEPISRPHKSNKGTPKPAKLRASITPGTVLIVLAGRFKGKRVVFLKQLPQSGLLLVSGPYKVNGVPLRRVNQSYVIATSTKVDVSGVKVPETVNDAYFSKKVVPDEEGKRKAAWLAQRKADQKSVDEALEKAVGAAPLLRDYLAARFTLSNYEAPHLMKF